MKAFVRRTSRTPSYWTLTQAMISARTLRGERKEEREKERERRTTQRARKGLNLLKLDWKIKRLDLLELSLGLALTHTDGTRGGRGVAMDDSKGGHTPRWVPRVNDIGDVFDGISKKLPLPILQLEAVRDANDVEL